MHTKCTVYAENVPKCTQEQKHHNNLKSLDIFNNAKIQTVPNHSSNYISATDATDFIFMVLIVISDLACVEINPESDDSIF